MPTQIIAKIDEKGNVTAGSHLNCVLEGDLYIITYDTELFKSTPAVIVTPDSTLLGHTYTVAASVHDSTPHSCKISVQNLNGNNVKAAINVLISDPV